MTILRLDMNEDRPETAMRRLGITYSEYEAFPEARCWVFWDCVDVPKKLPPGMIRLTT